MALAKEEIRQILSQNDISSVAYIYALLKDSFKDILQELMEAEMDAALGYEKNQKGDLVTTNKRNGHSSKSIKSQYGELQLDIPGDRNGEFEPKLIPRYQSDILIFCCTYFFHLPLVFLLCSSCMNKYNFSSYNVINKCLGYRNV